MSNRYGDTSEFPRSQKFVPKASNSASSEPSTSFNTLSASLRSSLPGQSSDATPGSSVCRVQVGEDGDWVSSGAHGGNFVNYLPQDEAIAAGICADESGLDSVESQRVVDLLNRELSRLLKLNPKRFWREVASDVSLCSFLDSFLQFRNRWFDFPHRGAKALVAGVIVGDFDLGRRVFMVLYRISSNRDPGLKASESLNLKDHAALLQEKKLLDLPKLLDICSIYGHENEQLTSSLVLNALKSQPEIHDSLTSLLCHFMNIIHTMHQRCNTSLESLMSANCHDNQGYAHLFSDFLEVMDFLNDAVVSMDAFVTAYKPAAVFFSSTVEMSYGNEELLRTLSSLHDSLLPSLQRGFKTIFTAKDILKNTSDDMPVHVALSLKMLSSRLVAFGWNLLQSCYLTYTPFHHQTPITKILPSNVEDPSVRADILIQLFREINASRNPRGSFLQNMEREFQLMSKLESLRIDGWISMGDEQIGFLYAITIQPNHTSTSACTTSTSTDTANTISKQLEEDSIIAESKISQILDLFPDYGKGFVSACLEAYNDDPEEVIQRILEGSLHEDLRSLNTSLQTKPGPLPKPSISAKGKEKVSGSQAPSPSVVSSSTGRFVRKPGDDMPDPSLLDRGDVGEKTAALASGMEYEDEYDDSFDDLGLNVGESGSEETEVGLGNKSRDAQFFVKDGKNYAYKVAGSVAVRDAREASAVNRVQREMIHGLGRGGNRAMIDMGEMSEGEKKEDEGRGGWRRRGGGRSGNYRKAQSLKKHLTGLGGF